MRSTPVLLAALAAGCMARTDYHWPAGPADTGDSDATGPVDPSQPLLGAGWTGSTSLADYPKSGPVTDGGIIVDIDDGAGGKTAEQRLADALALLSSSDLVLIRNNSGRPVTLTQAIRHRASAWPARKRVFAYGEQRIKLDLSQVPGAKALFFAAAGHEHWKGFEVVGATTALDAVIVINDAQGITLEDFWIHHNPSQTATVQVLGSTDVVLQDCLLWHNGDGVSGSGGVGIGAYQGTVRLAVVRCFVANAAATGISFWGASDSQAVDSVVIAAGKYWNGTLAEDGLGYLMGGSASLAGGNRLTGCAAIDNTAGGANVNYAQGLCAASHVTAHGNNNPLGTSSPGNIEFYAGPHLVDHVLSSGSANTAGDVNGGQDVATPPVVATLNCWNEPFQSDTSLLCRNPRFADPAGGDFSLLADSPYIGAGQGGATLGASVIALELLQQNWTRR